MAKFGHIKLDGKDYILDLSTYKGRDVIDFSPRSSTPGGGAVMSTLGFYQPIAYQTDWRAGFGFPWHTEGAGYLRTEGELDSRHEGMVMMMTKTSKSDSSSTQVDHILAYKGEVFAGTAGKGIRKHNGASWSSVSDTTWAINDLWHNGHRIFASPDGKRIAYADTVGDSDDWINTGLNDSAIDFKWISHHDGYVYAGREMNDSEQFGNEIYYDDNILLTGLAGNPTDDPAVIYAGLAGMQVKGGVTFPGGGFLFPRPDGLYRMNSDKNGATRMLDYFDQADTDNFATFAVWHGFLVYNIKDGLMRWNGTTETPITPGRTTDVFPYTTYGRFRHLTAVGDWLFVVGRTNESTYEEHILAYDGAAWHKVSEPITGGSGTISAMAYDASNNYLWFHRTSDGETHFIEMQAYSEYPFARFSKTGIHRLVTSRFDGGFRMVPKSTPSILIAAQNTDTGTFLKVQYSINGDSWLAWGGEDAATNAIRADSYTVLRNPLGVDRSTLEYNYLQLGIDFVTDDSTQSPILEDVVVRGLMRPEELYGFSLPIVVGSNQEHGMAIDERTTSEIIADIKKARASISPIIYKDPRGDEYWGYLTSFNEQMVEEHANELGDPDIEERVWLNFVEVG